MKYNALFAFLIIAICSCQPPRNESFNLQGFEPKTDLLSPETLWSLGRIGEFAASPNGEEVIYTVTYSNISENRNYTDIYLVNSSTKEKKQLTSTSENEFSIGWRPDGKKVSFLSAKSGTVQLYEMDLDGANVVQVTQIEGGIEGYMYAPDLSMLLYVSAVKLDSTIHDLYPDLPLADARIETDLMYRHWDSWHDYTYNHPFIVDYQNQKIIGESFDLMKDEHYDTPLKPFGGMEQLAWSPDSKSIVYSCKKLVGKAYALSTNSDVYIYNLADKTTTNLSEGIGGYDINPTFSPNGSYLAWESMEHDGFEADKNRLMLLNLSTGEKNDLTKGFDQSIQQIKWSSDNQKLFFISDYHATENVYELTLNSDSIKQITFGEHDVTGYELSGNKLITTQMSMSHPIDIYAQDFKDNSTINLSDVNEKALSKLKFGKVEGRWIETTDKKQMLTWIIYPPNFDSAKKYPVLLYCQGGPQSAVSQFWSLRWNFQIMAANGYIVVAPNRRGLPGFGQAWNDQISGDYGGQNMQDYLSAIDAVAKESYADETRMGAVGASYGGYSVYWLAGNHNKRFKAFIAHCGIFNFEQMYVTTEEMFFVNWDYKGAFWDLSNKEAQHSYSFSPHKFIQNWDTPIMVIHGEKDLRIPYTQGMGAFNTAVLKGIPARFLFFPNENHWVLSAQNGILWQREYFAWLDKWLK